MAQNRISASKAQDRIIFVSQDPTVVPTYGDVNTIALLVGSSGAWIKTDGGTSTNWTALVATPGSDPTTFSFPSVGGSAADNGKLVANVGGNALVQSASGGVAGSPSSFDLEVLQVGDPGNPFSQNRIIEWEETAGNADSGVPTIDLDFTGLANLNEGDTLDIRSNYSGNFSSGNYSGTIDSGIGAFSTVMTGLTAGEIGATLQDTLDNIVALWNAPGIISDYLTASRDGNILRLTPVAANRLSLVDMLRLQIDYNSTSRLSILNLSGIGDRIFFENTLGIAGTTGVVFLFQPAASQTMTDAGQVIGTNIALPGFPGGIGGIVLVNDYTTPMGDFADKLLQAMDTRLGDLLVFIGQPNYGVASQPSAFSVRYEFQADFGGVNGNSIDVSNLPSMGGNQPNWGTFTEIQPGLDPTSPTELQLGVSGFAGSLFSGVFVCGLDWMPQMNTTDEATAIAAILNTGFMNAGAPLQANAIGNVITISTTDDRGISAVSISQQMGTYLLSNANQGTAPFPAGFYSIPLGKQKGWNADTAFIEALTVAEVTLAENLMAGDIVSLAADGEVALLQVSFNADGQLISNARVGTLLLSGNTGQVRPVLLDFQAGASYTPLNPMNLQNNP